MTSLITAPDRREEREREKLCVGVCVCELGIPTQTDVQKITIATG